ncbi:MAG: alpha-amylase [Mediterranea sp.]|jgi:1,4-alpha-glucan branching enzyme|nr:alpha-amylase [Mediterranea sp.]
MMNETKKIRSLWLALLIVAACSDDKAPITPPAPIPDGITLSPESLEDTAEATITFKASATSALYGYTGDVYAHIGIVEGSDWLFVPAGWNENITKCKMAKGEENVWSLSLSSSVRSWFGVTNGMPIQKIGIVFRSSDGTKQEPDAFIDVADNTFRPAGTVLEAQPAGTREGINIIDGTTVTFVLYDKDTKDKHKEYAYVTGDFNDWQISNNYQMKRDETTGCWWYTLTGLNAQEEYAFQYYAGTEAGGNVRLADAYTEKVIDPMDAEIPAATHPDLRPYPSGKTAGIISTFKIQPDTYAWQVPNYTVADKRNPVIYEMLFRDFTATGDINGAMEKLDYLQALGVNAVELMPVQEFDGNDSWGYNPCFYFALDKAYGTKQKYKAFIDECHKRGMAVILDVVYNHATGANPFAKLYWNPATDKTASNNPWFNVNAPHPYSVFHDFNHESPIVRKFVKRNLKFLLDEYNVDGFRFDLTKGFTQKKTTETTASNYDQSRIDILKDYNAAIKAANPDAIVILEHFAVEAEEKELAQDGMQLWRNLNNAYCQTGMGYKDNSAFTALATQNTAMPFGSWVGYMESHDEERVSYKQITWGVDAVKINPDTRMKQLQANASLFFTVPGPKMIWQFGELGYDTSIEENGRTGKKPVRWEYYEDPHRRGLYNTYCQLIKLRTAVPQLFDAGSTLVWKVTANDWDNGRTLSLKTHDGKALVALANFTNAEITCTPTFPATGTWYNFIDQSTLYVETAGQTIKIPANSYLLYTNFPR